MNRCRLAYTLRSLILTLLVVSTVWAGNDKAWEALHNLDIVKAKSLFESELAKNPDDIASMRGLLIASHFDLDYATQLMMIEKLTTANPDNPYLIPLSEYILAGLRDWARCNKLSFNIGEALSNNASGANAHTGRLLMEGYYQTADMKLPDSWSEKMNYAPGCWICGPFENNSNIAAYRPVEFENKPLDTLMVSTGKIGSKIGWTWLPVDDFGNFYPYFAIENSQDIALQARYYFEIPSEQEILVLMGGALSYRILFDGVKVHDDPRYRNAVQREAFKIKAAPGMHEITVVMGKTDQGITFGLEVLDTNYEPIEGFKWHRYSRIERGGNFEVEKLHPLFDPFEDYVLKNGEQPDTRFWRTYLQMYNGYSDEAVSSLESLYNADRLSPMEVYLLCEALRINDETPMALRYLGALVEAVKTPLTEYLWIENTVDNYEVKINSFCHLDSLYPDRFPIELSAALKPILKQDLISLFANYDSLKQKYADAVGIRRFLMVMYSQIIPDPEAAYREAIEYCKQAQEKRYLISTEAHYLVTLARYDEAIEKAREAFELLKYSDQALAELYNAYRMAKREREMIPLLDSLRAIYPYNIELYSTLYDIYSGAGEYDRANEILEKIHDLKPSAIKPYRALESLHNNVSYDEIFGTVDIMDYWDETPSEKKRGNKNYWYLLDRRQALLFDSGVVFKDIHYAIALLDEEITSQFQEMYLGFDPDYSFGKLLVAQRLRKGEPPLAGTVEGEYAVFQDLKPGDVVEVHYRYWESQEGDLWNEFWATYLTHSDFYQRYWEYAVISARDDIKYISFDPAPDPKVSNHFGYKKYSWRGEKTEAMDLDLAMLPPYADIVGNVFISTIDNWSTLNDWYNSISTAIISDNPRAVALADNLVTDDMTDNEKLEALFKHIVLEIPYQMIGFDYHASIPRKPDDVLLNRWGDCKDKGHLLIQMLRYVGIEAWPVLVMTREQGTQMPLPYFGFNHLITGCVIDGDTIYVDATDLPVYPQASIANDIAGQPILEIGLNRSQKKLKRLPEADKKDTHWNMKLVFEPNGDNTYDFQYIREYHNIEAGITRYDLRGYTEEELKKDIESNYSDKWEVILSIDSIYFDDVKNVDSQFKEIWYGKMKLTTQTIGNSTVVNLPKWSTISKSLLSLLGDPKIREFPIDRNSYIGIFNKELEFHVPEKYGEPKLVEPFKLGKGPFQFIYDYSWDDDSRVLAITYDLEIEQGYSKGKDFIEYMSKIIEVFDSPLLFEKK